VLGVGEDDKWNIYLELRERS